jgi:trk system potassium uptake protein TrkH
MNGLFKKLYKVLSPVQIISLSFLFIIFVGGILLSLPISHQQGVDVPVLDAFFTTVSAVCVTGLVTVVTATTWSLFGKLVIMLLIQIGGLSLITVLAFFMINFGKKVTLKNRLTIQAAFNHSSLGGMVRMVLFVIKGTFLCETIGAVILFFSFMGQGTLWYKALFYGIFHSVSAFCNAGFDIIVEQNLIPYSSSFTISMVIIVLIVVGGIGFTVWRELVDKVVFKVSPHIKQNRRFSLHAKLALIMTATLILSGTIFFLIVEYNNPETLGNFAFPHKLLASLFQSVTLRTAGFATIPQSGLTEVSKFISSIFMMIGGSPGGTAGGIKTVTLAIVLCSVWSIIKGRKSILAFERTITVATLQKALAIIVLMLLLLFMGTAVLSITEDHTVFPHSAIDLLFEVSSALGTVGLSTGITPFLTWIGKLVLMLCMFIGRIGPITLIVSLAHAHNAEDLVRYPSEDVMIG